MAQELNCPNCGAALSAHVAHTKMIACDHCDSVSVLVDDALVFAGERGVLADHPSLFALNEPTRYAGETYIPVGQVRYAYGGGRGEWDEFWAQTASGDPVWISVDEGDIAIERPIRPPKIALLDSLRVGAAVQLSATRFRVTEADAARVMAVRGELPEALRVGDAFRYWHLSGPGQRLVTLELSAGEDVFRAFDGEWVDPFAITARADEGPL